MPAPAAQEIRLLGEAAGLTLAASYGELDTGVALTRRPSAWSPACSARRTRRLRRARLQALGPSRRMRRPGSGARARAARRFWTMQQPCPAFVNKLVSCKYMCFPCYPFFTSSPASCFSQGHTSSPTA